ncbi:MAG TPA: hypothetical protein VF142_11105, partial [Longimicrobium sp.]
MSPSLSADSAGVPPLAAGDGPAAAPRAELPFTLGAERGGAAPALAAWVLLLARDRGEDAVRVDVRTPAGAASLHLTVAGNPSAVELVARINAALAPVWTDADARVPLLATAAAADGGAGTGL